MTPDTLLNLLAKEWNGQVSAADEVPAAAALRTGELADFELWAARAMYERGAVEEAAAFLSRAASHAIRRQATVKLQLRVLRAAVGSNAISNRTKAETRQSHNKDKSQRKLKDNNQVRIKLRPREPRAAEGSGKFRSSGY